IPFQALSLRSSVPHSGESFSEVLRAVIVNVRCNLRSKLFNHSPLEIATRTVRFPNYSQSIMEGSDYIVVQRNDDLAVLVDESPFQNRISGGHLRDRGESVRERHDCLVLTRNLFIWSFAVCGISRTAWRIR